MTFPRRLESVIFRVDAGLGIGAGHALRCLTVAAALKERFDGKIKFVFRSMHPELRERIAELDFGITEIPVDGVSDVDAIESEARRSGPSAVVVDSYRPELYAPSAQARIRGASAKFIFIVFDPAAHYLADVLHNQNPRARIEDFSVESYTKCLFGLGFLVLRSDVRRAALTTHPADTLPAAMTVLLTFGSSDAHQMSEHALQALEFVEGPISKVLVVVGSLCERGEAIAELARRSRYDVEVFHDPPNLTELMVACDIGLTAGGTTNWELGAIGRPLVILPVGSRETSSACHLAELGWAQVIFDATSMTPRELGKALSRALSARALDCARRLRLAINLDGVERLVDEILE